VEDGVSDVVGPGFNSPHLHQGSTSGLISSSVASTHLTCVLADIGTVLMGVQRIRLQRIMGAGGNGSRLPSIEVRALRAPRPELEQRKTTKAKNNILSMRNRVAKAFTAPVAPAFAYAA